MKKSEVYRSLSDCNNDKYTLEVTNQFKKNFILCVERGKNKQLLMDAVKILLQSGVLPAEYKSHPLKGYKLKNNEKIMECHLQSDWLMVWIQSDTRLTILLTDTGSHSDIFNR
jgi:mRNA interferase YafQ